MQSWVSVVVKMIQTPPDSAVEEQGVALEGWAGCDWTGTQVEVLEAEAEAAVVVWPRSPPLPSGQQRETGLSQRAFCSFLSIRKSLCGSQSDVAD